jgi:hypothetical protein
VPLNFETLRLSTGLEWSLLQSFALDPTWTLFASTVVVVASTFWAPFLENRLGQILIKQQFLKLVLEPLGGNTSALISKPRLKALYLKRRSFALSLERFVKGLPSLPWCSGIVWVFTNSQLSLKATLLLICAVWLFRYCWDLLRSDNWQKITHWRQEIGSMPHQTVNTQLANDLAFKKLSLRLISESRTLHSHSLTTTLWLLWLAHAFSLQLPLFPYLAAVVGSRFVLELWWKRAHQTLRFKLESPRSDFRGNTVEGQLFWIWSRCETSLRRLWPLVSSSWDPFLATVLLGLAGLFKMGALR